MSLLPAWQSWLGQIVFPVTILGILALIARALMFKANAARRSIVGYAALAAMTVALFSPWLPKVGTLDATATAPMVKMRDEAIYSMEKSVSPALTTGPQSQPIFTLQDLLWGLYLGITLVMVARLSIDLLRLHRIRQSAEPFPTFSAYPVFCSAKIPVPIALDGLQRSILLPYAAKEWSQETLASVLGHEEAHLRHRDGLWLLLNQVLCTILWFNPVVWLVGSRFRRDIEFLADDEVVLSGVVASDYAQDMLKAAKCARRTSLAGATAFAEKANLKHRIASVLSPNHHRERVGMKKIGIAFVTASLAAVGVAGWQKGTDQKVANPTSWSPDVRAGLTVPANPRNGFVGVLKDGRKVELVQITQRVGETLKAWTPDGKTIPSKSVIPVGRVSGKRDKMRYLLFRIERSKKSVDMQAALGSGKSTPDDPTTMAFAGGWMLKDDGGPYRYAVSLIEIEETGGSTGYFTMSLYDDAWNLEGKINPNSRFNPSFGSIEYLKLRSIVEPQDKLREHWTKNNPGPWIELTWKSKDGREMDDVRQVAVVWTPKGLVEKEPEGSYGGYKGSQFFARYYLSGPLTNIRELRFYSRTFQGVEINGVKLRPNQVP